MRVKSTTTLVVLENLAMVVSLNQTKIRLDLLQTSKVKLKPSVVTSVLSEKLFMSSCKDLRASLLRKISMPKLQPSKMPLLIWRVGSMSVILIKTLLQLP